MDSSNAAGEGAGGSDAEDNEGLGWVIPLAVVAALLVAGGMGVAAVVALRRR